jgi:hypothetical protein
MVDFPNLCTKVDESVGAHELSVITSRPDSTANWRAAVAAILPEHYAAEEQVARILRLRRHKGLADNSCQQYPNRCGAGYGALGRLVTRRRVQVRPTSVQQDQANVPKSPR